MVVACALPTEVAPAPGCVDCPNVETPSIATAALAIMVVFKKSLRDVLMLLLASFPWRLSFRDMLE